MQYSHPVIDVTVVVENACSNDLAEVLNRLARGNVRVRLIGVQLNSHSVKEVEKLLIPAVPFTPVTSVESVRSCEDLLRPNSLVVVGPSTATSLCSYLEKKGAQVILYLPNPEDCSNGSPTHLPTISSLSTLLQWVPQSHRRCTAAHIVAYAMAPSREASLATRGLLPFVPTNGVCFMPVDITGPKVDIPGDVDAVLHMGTAFLECDAVSGLLRPAASLVALQHEAQRRGLPFIEPIHHVMQVASRSSFLRILQCLKSVSSPTGTGIRGPKFFEIGCVEDIAVGLGRQFIGLPCVIKPLVACGLHSSHQMAVLCDMGALHQLKVPLPACVQEFVDHDTCLHKVYVIGRQVFSAARVSIPNLKSMLMKEGVYNFHSFSEYAALFDDLASMSCSGLPLDMSAVSAAADWLRGALGLRLFGFDVLVDADNGEHVVVDVNYFPTFKDVSDAAEAFHMAMNDIIAEHRSKTRAGNNHQ